MEWMLMPLKRYADFGGRSQRKEYWMFILLQIIVLLPLFLLVGVTGSFEEGSEEMSGVGLLFLGLIGLFILAMLIPSLAVQVRRLHDTDRSGWWILLGLIPVVNYVGSIVLLVFYCLDGTKGENRFGPDPKMNENVGDVFS